MLVRPHACGRNQRILPGHLTLISARRESQLIGLELPGGRWGGAAFGHICEVWTLRDLACRLLVRPPSDNSDVGYMKSSRVSWRALRSGALIRYHGIPALDPCQWRMDICHELWTHTRSLAGGSPCSQDSRVLMHRRLQTLSGRKSVRGGLRSTLVGGWNYNVGESGRDYPACRGHGDLLWRYRKWKRRGD